MSRVTAPIFTITSGHLECRRCGLQTFWCEHIQEVITTGEDAHEIWDRDLPADEMEKELNGFKLQVPYVPTRNQWAECHLGEAHHGNFKVYYVNASSGEMHFLGFLSPGEGRAVIRGMLHNWFLPRVNERDECASSTHSFKAQQIWEKDTRKKDSTAWLAQRWSVFQTTLCVVCADKTTDLSDPDLVPDSGRTRTPWNR